jgi:hypothetical protein
MARSTAISRPVWYQRPARHNAALIVYALVLALITLVGATAGGFVLIGLILAGIELVLIAVLVVALSPLIMLRADEIRIWHGFRFTNIGIGEIAGLGMLYTHTVGSGGYWAVAVWRDDGSYEATAVTFLLGRMPLAPGKGARWMRQATYDPVAASEIPALNKSRAATICRDLCERVLAAQGPDGPLATRHLEKHQRPVRPAPFIQLIAYWSPDGQFGRCR